MSMLNEMSNVKCQTRGKNLNNRERALIAVSKDAVLKTSHGIEMQDSKLSSVLLVPVPNPADLYK